MVEVENTNNQNKASLRDQHWEKAREHLTGADKVPVTAVAGFLYRDFALEYDFMPDGEDLVNVFRDEFGYDSDDPDERAEFDHLYTTDDIEIVNEDFTQI
ncbi:hypothetical protein KM295_15885 [Natronomonas sp. F2-12]|uniref:Uncharacterized protein n=1 Tax=Natronomonas aquatica TaxID=2841590 RepID=A0A9R1CWA6_9EURY|nr:hypothetical protein [Natronomonas aquatica]MCQ4334932.1 hypothetical protein [Natronomonas aquatica]